MFMELPSSRKRLSSDMRWGYGGGREWLILESLQSDHSRRQTRCLQIPKLVTNMVTVMPTEPSGHRGKRNL